MKFDGERWQLFGPIIEDSGPAMTRLLILRSAPLRASRRMAASPALVSMVRDAAQKARLLTMRPSVLPGRVKDA